MQSTLGCPKVNWNSQVKRFSGRGSGVTSFPNQPANKQSRAGQGQEWNQTESRGEEVGLRENWKEDRTLAKMSPSHSLKAWRRFWGGLKRQNKIKQKKDGCGNAKMNKKNFPLGCRGPERLSRVPPERFSNQHKFGPEVTSVSTLSCSQDCSQSSCITLSPSYRLQYTADTQVWRSSPDLLGHFGAPGSWVVLVIPKY